MTPISHSAVDASIAKEMGFAPDAVIPVSGQTYSRKVDAIILNALAGIAQSCYEVRHRHAPAGQLQGDGGAV